MSLPPHFQCTEEPNPVKDKRSLLFHFKIQTQLVAYDLFIFHVNPYLKMTILYSIYIQYWTKHLQPTSSNAKKCS